MNIKKSEKNMKNEDEENEDENEELTEQYSILLEKLIEEYGILEEKILALLYKIREKHNKSEEDQCDCLEPIFVATVIDSGYSNLAVEKRCINCGGWILN